MALQTEILKSKNHIMLDVESLGSAPDGVVTSIGAVQFCPIQGIIFDRFKINIGIQSALNKGLKIDGSTLDFWFNQTKEAQQAMLCDPVPLEDALKEFRKWVLKLDSDDMWWWANGANYDFVILDSTFKAAKSRVPWKYTRLMDMRMLKQLTGYKAPNSYYEDNYHDSLADCERQVKMLKEILEIMLS